MTSSAVPPSSADEHRSTRPERAHSQGHRRNLSTEVSESARLDVIVPRSSNIDIATAIATADPSKAPSGSNVPCVAHIEQRNHLFYDEQLPVYVVLEILAPLDDDIYEHYLSRLAVSLEITAVDSQQRQSQGHPARGNHEPVHLLYQTTVDEKSNPRIPIPKKRLLVWKLNVPLGHPRARLTSPRVILTCSATLRPADTQKPQYEDEYMTTRQPMGLNLLEPFSDDPALSQVAPRLSALRVSRVIPASSTAQPAFRPMGYAAKRSFPIYPAISIRLRCNRIPAGGKHIVMASLDLEVTQVADCSVTFTRITVALAGGQAELLTDESSDSVPVTCQPKDDVTFLYRLTRSDVGNGNSNSLPPAPNQHVHAISLTLEATVLVSDDCRPSISMSWTTPVDFAPPPALQFPTHGSLQRANRPPSLGAIVHGATVGSTVSASSGIKAAYQSSPLPTPNVVFTPPVESLRFSGNSSDPGALGLTITFTGPSRVFVGEVFVWNVFVVNRSDRIRDLSLGIPPKLKKTGEGKTLPAPPASGPPDPVVDESMVWQNHKTHHLEPAELIPLVNDLRIVRLLPSSCQSAELRFVPVRTGLLSIESVSVVDLSTNEMTTCRNLPCIISVPRPAEK